MSSRRNQLSKEQVKQLERLRASFWDEVRKRATAILELNQGSSLRTVAQNSDVSMSTVSRWWKSWKADGDQGLIPKHLREAGAIKLEQELKDAQEKAQQAQEDYKRLAKLQELPKSSRDTLKTFQSLLPIIDDFDHALENRPKDINENPWIEGVEMIKSNFEKLLKRYEIEAIDPAAGDRFDSNFHQTIGAQDSDEVESGHVTETLRKGYRAGEIVLRDALVLIAR